MWKNSSNCPLERTTTRRAIALFVSIVMSVCNVATQAADANGFGPTFKTGHVLARGILLGENGQPIFAEYNEQGQVIRQFGEAVGELQGAKIMSADDYRFRYGQFLDFKTAFGTTRARAAKVLTRTEYLATEFGSVTLPDLNGEEGATIEVPIGKPELGAGDRSVLVRDIETIVTRDIAENDLILFSSDIDLRDAEGQLGSDNAFSDADTRSLLVNSEGQLIRRSTLDIGLRTSFWNRLDGDQLDNAEFDGRSGYRAGDTPVAPIAEALVYPDMQSHNTARTDENGQFSLYFFLPPCPGFTWLYDYNLIGEIPYRNFNPKSRAWQPWSVYYTTVPVSDYCDGTALNLSTATNLTAQSVHNTLVGINASRPTPIVRADMPVLANMLTGVGMITNDGQQPVDLGEQTEYSVEPSLASIAAIPQNLDLDADRNPDDVRIGQDGKVEVRFDSDSEDPDFTRVVDTLPDFSDQGLLKTLKPEDLADTDIFVYRQSTGQLLVDREGLTDEEYGSYNLICSEGDPDCLADGQEPTNRFFYQMLIRGRWYYDHIAGALPDYQSKTRINSELRGLDSNHLRAGEEIKLIAINRKTGYIGTAVARVKAGGAEQNALSFDIPPLMLQPPNLKIEAKRSLEIEAGLTRGEEREYIIGSEGSGLTSDKVIVVTTEWVDQDGTPLPDDLPGYTGRLAKIIDTNVLGATTSQLSNFAIRPGRRTQIIQLSEGDILGRDHYYIHVSGEPVDGNPGFGKTGGAGEGALAFRPDYYVPIRVPVFDEDATREARNAVRYAQQDGLTDLELDDIDPIYQWPHRPEMQFSVFDLTVNRIASLDEAEDEFESDIQTIIYDPNSDEDCERDSETLLQCFLNNADILTFDYDLFANPDDPLPAIGPDRTLVLGLGGEEVVIGPQYGADQTIRFEDPEHLRNLDTADYLTISLFQNNDAENLLWEFDLVKASLVVDSNRDGFLQSEDPEETAVSFTEPVDTGSGVNLLPAAIAQTNVPPSNLFGPEKDTNSQSNPFRWWFNDDDDRGEVSGEQAGRGDSGDRPVSIPPGGDANYDVQQSAPRDPDNPNTNDPGINNFVPDFRNVHVDGMRDLVDFFAVHLDIKQALENFPPDEYSYRLSHGQAALKYVETYLKPKTQKNANLPAEELSDAYIQTSGDVTKELAEAPTVEITREGVDLPVEFLERIRDNDEGIILIEAMDTGFDYNPRTAGRECEEVKDSAICDPLELRIIPKRPGSTEKSINGRSRLFLKIRGVEEMYRHINIRDRLPGKIETVPDRPGEPDNNPDTADNDNYMVWVHGYNVAEPNARGWQAEIFKRFYLLGVKTRFIGVTWAGDTGGLQFGRASFNALRMGEELYKELRNKIPPGAKWSALGHSAGNLIVSEAIQRYGVRPTKYFAIDAAVPLQAYNPGQTEGRNGEVMKPRMIPNSQKPYSEVVDSNMNEVLYAVNWHKNFPATDPRSKLTWDGYFSSVPVVTEMINLYSSGEDVLESAFEEESFWRNVDRLLKEGGVTTGRHAWTTANISAGCPNFITARIFGRPEFVPAVPVSGGEVIDLNTLLPDSVCMAGWELNKRVRDLERIGVLINAGGQGDERYRAATAREAKSRYDSGLLTPNQLTQIGFFQKFLPPFEHLYAPADRQPDINGAIFSMVIAKELASNPDIQRLFLAFGIAAVSYPTGNNMIASTAASNIENIDMNADINGWPSFRNEDIDRNQVPDWRHSDIRVIAPQYTINTVKGIKIIHEK